MTRDVPRSAPVPPELAGEFDSIREVGWGRKTVVALARVRSTGRPVTIKRLRPEYSEDREALGKLARESRAGSGLEHRNIVGLLGVRRLEDGGPALIREFVPGVTLTEHISTAGPLSPREAERVLRDVARAVTHAHRSGVVHGDLRPEKVLLDDVSGVARVTGFEHVRDEGAAKDLALAEVDGTTDVRGLGAMGYEMLTGRRPSPQPDPRALGGGASASILDRLPPDLPGRLREALERALTVGAGQGQGAEAFLAALGDEEAGPQTGWGGPDHRPGGDGSPPRAADEAAPRPISPASVPAWLRELEDPPPSGESPPASETESGESTGETIATESRSWDAGRPPRRRGDRRGILALLGLLLLGGPLAVFAVADGRTAFLEELRVMVPWAAGNSQASRTVSDGQGDRGDVVGGTGSAEVAGLVVVGARSRLGAPGRPLAGPVTVRVLDERGLGLPGVEVSFEVVSGGGGVEPATGTSGSGGGASTTWTLGESEGPQVLRARVAEDASAEGFSIEVTAQASTGPVAAATPDGSEPGSWEDPPDPDGDPEQAPGGGDPEEAPGGEDGEPEEPPVDEVELDAAGVDPRPPPTRSAGPLLRVRSGAFAGGTYSCRLGGDGRVGCWGDNRNGQLGDGTGENRAAPGASVVGGPFATLAAGVSHACALTRTGRLFCWGRNESGQLGDGTTTSRPSPVRVSADLMFSDVSAGASHSCALAEDGAAYCWGANEDGQLGDATTTARQAPARVAASLRYRSIVTGWSHTCALDEGGAAHCWGADGSRGAAVDGSGSSSAPRPAGGSHRFRALAAGGGHTCGLTNEGEVFCWGENGAGQLGDGTRRNRPTPWRIAEAGPFVEVVAGGVHSCARTAAGEVLCWGDNSYGQLGDGTTRGRLVPEPVRGDAVFGQIEARGSHTCGRTEQGEVLCWGYNLDGQLGDGTRENRHEPTRVRERGPT